jgi:poly-gamma-glutamate synthesis protein (capsule biosynthesis protein)
VVHQVRPGEREPTGAETLYSEPVAFFVPFTFPLEAIEAADATRLLDGEPDDWGDVGGPPGAVEEAKDPAGVSHGELAVVPWDGPVLGAKPLQVDGLLPHGEGYEPADRWVAIGVPADLAQELSPAEPEPDYVTLAAVGDMMFARTVADGIATDGPDYAFDEAERLLEADITFGNLECVLSDRGTPADKGYTFAGDPSVAEALADAGFDVLSVANNHSMDYGPDAFLDTLDHLEDAGVAYAGGGEDDTAARQPAIVEAGGLRIAFLAYGAFFEEPSFPIAMQEAAPGQPGIAWGDLDEVTEDVAAASEAADVVVVSMHSGYEYTPELWQTQIALARTAVDAGAALVLGSGPHVLQGIEYYNDGVIAYSLGNFVFDFDEQDRAVPGMPSALSGVLVAALDEDGVRGIEFRPAFIAETRPAPAGEEADRVYDWFYPLVDALGG